jgi:hypothetical protein
MVRFVTPNERNIEQNWKYLLRCSVSLPSASEHIREMIQSGEKKVLSDKSLKLVHRQPSCWPLKGALSPWEEGYLHLPLCGCSTRSSHI